MRVYAKVAADLFHFGHVRFFKQARMLGSHLTVSVVPDERIEHYKGRPPLFTKDQRMELIASCRWVDEVIDYGPKILTVDFMTEHNFDIYAFGAKDEQELNIKLLDCVELPEAMIAEIPYSPEISSSKLRAALFGTLD